MTKYSPHLVIADPSLADTRGHHFSLSLQIARGAQLQGVKPIWFTHKDFIVPKWLNIEVYPVFSVTMYDRYQSKTKDNLPKNIELNLLNELQEGIYKSSTSEYDHIYFHTGFGDLYRAILMFFSSSFKWENLPQIHICTPYDLVTMPGKNSVEELSNIFKGIRTIPAVDKKLFFWAETPQLAQHYTLTYGFNVRSMPLPPPTNFNVDAKKIDLGVLKVVYLGAAREEKGFLHIPEIVESLYEPYGRRREIEFIIQCSPQIIGYLPSIKEAIEKLSVYSEPYIKLIDKELNEDDYHLCLMESDVLLLLYNKKAYKIRGSGIAVEAISSNKCILTYKDTFCASLVTNGGGAIVDEDSEAVAALIDMIENQIKYRQNAAHQGERYRKENSVENYVLKIMNRTSFNSLLTCLPSNVIGHISPLLLKM